MALLLFSRKWRLVPLLAIPLQHKQQLRICKTTKSPYTCPSGLPPTTEFTTNITHRSSHISMHLIFAQIWKPPTEFNLLSSLKCPTNTFSSTVEVAYPPTCTTKHSAHSREKAKCKRRRTEVVNILRDEQRSQYTEASNEGLRTEFGPPMYLVWPTRCSS